MEKNLDSQMRVPWRDYITLLRLPFQFLLSPVFLWGFMVAGGRPDLNLVLAYLAFHLFGYAGGTALNSYYDRDEGPVGGLAQPPPIPPHLLAFSLVWQAVGFLLALLVSLPIALLYLIMFWLSVAYSHPGPRLKGRPILALITVFLGQGILPFLAGWVTVRGDLLVATPAAFAAMLGGALIIVGVYPLTQLYQLEADAQRGDLTAARYLGTARAFWFAAAAIGTGGLLTAWAVAILFSVIEALGMLAFIIVLLVVLDRWRVRVHVQSVQEMFKTVMRLYAAVTLPFLIWISVRLIVAAVS